MQTATHQNHSRIADHKAQVGRALSGVKVVGIYHDKDEILILRTETQAIRYRPFDDFKVIFKGKTYCNVSLKTLKEIVEEGKLKL